MKFLAGLVAAVALALSAPLVASASYEGGGGGWPPCGPANNGVYYYTQGYIYRCQYSTSPSWQVCGGGECWHWAYVGRY